MSWIQSYRNRRVDSDGERTAGRRASAVSDSISLTQSQIDMSIFKMSPPKNKCEQICRNRPITTFGKVKQILKMVSIIMIPLVVLIGITTNTFSNMLSNYAKSSAARDTLLYSMRLGSVIHYLQEERDMSALYLSSIQKKTKALLLKQYIKTDLSLESFRFYKRGPTMLRNEFQSKENFLTYINKHRYELDRRDQTVDMELQFYTTLIRVFIVWLYNAVTEEQTGWFWLSLVAYQEVVLAKEYMGLERALGSVFYADGRFPSLSVYLWFSESQDVTNATILSAKRYSDLVHDLYEKNVYGNKKLLESLSWMRAEIRRNDLGGNGSINLAQWWFHNMTQYMDLLLIIQRELAIKIVMMQDKDQRSNMEKMCVISVVCLCVVIISIIIIYVIYILTDIIQKYSICIAERSKSFMKESRHSDRLMYQLLPKYISEMMKEQEEVVARNYPEVTVLFSDMQDFTEILSRSSPIQVIQMIDKLCFIFDDVLKQNDVYKIETIGDAYLITSGVPCTNDDRHAMEICRMALQVIRNAKTVDIPHLPGQTYTLRIGCHTGSIVAVVAGLKMPRYCLLGETLSIAARMKSLGEPSKIHITETTYDFVKSCEEFKIVERFDESIKEEMDMMQGINGRNRTFWVEDPIDSTGSANSMP